MLERRKREWEKLKESSPNFVFNQFPKRIQVTLKNFYEPPSENYARVQELMAQLHEPETNTYQSLFLYGDTGEGKTTLACAIVQEMLKKVFIETNEYFEYRSLYTLYDFFLSLRRTYNDRNVKDTEYNFLEKLENYPVLIVDDLGIEKGSEWEMYMLYGLVNNRHREMKCTIYTSNYSLEELSSKMENDRVVSRILSSSLVLNYFRS